MNNHGGMGDNERGLSQGAFNIPGAPAGLRQGTQTGNGEAPGGTCNHYNPADAARYMGPQSDAKVNVTCFSTNTYNFAFGYAGDYSVNLNLNDGGNQQQQIPASSNQTSSLVPFTSSGNALAMRNHGFGQPGCVHSQPLNNSCNHGHPTTPMPRGFQPIHPPGSVPYRLLPPSTPSQDSSMSNSVFGSPPEGY